MKIHVYSRCFYSMLGLTIWTLIPWWGLFIEARDWRKGSMAGSESCPQLISIRTFTLLSNAADLMASSIKGQYLFSERIQSEEIKQKEVSSFVETNLFLSWVQVHLRGFSKRVVGKYSMTATWTNSWASEMMERIASRSWVLDWGQNDGGEPWWKTQIWTPAKQQNIWFIKTSLVLAATAIHILYSHFSVNREIKLFFYQRGQYHVKQNRNLRSLLRDKACWRHYPFSPAGDDVCWWQCHTLQASAGAGSCWIVPSPSRTGKSSAGPLLVLSSCRLPLPVPSPAGKRVHCESVGQRVKVQN